MLLHDLKFAVRTLLKSPGFTCIAVLSLALAIGATAGVVSVVNALFAKELAVPAPNELVALSTFNPDRPDDPQPVLLSQFEELRRRNQVFSRMFAWRDVLPRNIEINGATYLGNVNEVSGDYFATLGVAPFLGRVLTTDDVGTIGAGSSARVAVLDYRCWEQRYGRDPNVLGKIMKVDGVDLTIVGVMPKDFVGLNIVAAADAVVPMGFEIGRIPDRATPGMISLNFYVAARLKPATTTEAAAQNVKAIWPGILEATLPAGAQAAQRTRFLSSRIGVESLRTGTTGGRLGLRSQLTRPLQQLLALSGMVLLVAFLNLAGLILTRAVARHHELGLRASLGAGKLDLIRVVVVEAAVVSIAGAALGLAAAFWTGPLLMRSLLKFEAFKPLAFDATPDLRVVAAAVAVSIAVGVVCALLPAWRVIGRNPVSALTQNTRAVRGGVTWFQKTVICVQVALAFVLIAGALLFGRTLYNLTSLDPGFRVNGVLTMRLFPQVKQQMIPERTAYYQDMARALAALPGVASATYALVPPLDVAVAMPVTRRSGGKATDAVVDPVGPGFFQTTGIAMVAGRDFDWHDDDRAPLVAVVSESVASQLFPEGNAIGQLIDLPAYPFGKAVQIVGIVKSASVWALRSHQPRAVYVALMQAPTFNHVVAAVRATGDPSPLARAAEQAVSSRGHQYSVMTRSLEQRLKFALGDERVLALLSAFFAGLTMLLATSGLYGLLSYAVTRRSSEIGVRMALGAERRDIVFMVLRQAATLVVIGMVIAIPATIMGIKLASDMLFGLSPYDPLTFALAAAILAIITLTAAFFPGRRASRLDPTHALRIE